MDDLTSQAIDNVVIICLNVLHLTLKKSEYIYPYLSGNFHVCEGTDENR